MNKKIIQRLLTFFIGVPLVIAIVFFLPQKNHLAINILVIIFCLLGSVELSDMLKKKNLRVGRSEAAILGASVPLAMTLVTSFGINPLVIPAIIVGGAGWLLVSCVFFSEEKLKFALGRIVAGFAVIVYPSSLFSWFILINALPHSTALLITFLCIAIANDSFAWAAGMLFGKGNRGIFIVSPNKSVAGFVAGIIASVGVGLALAFLVPDAFRPDSLPPRAAGILLGFFTGLSATFGDLAESALKRSADVKDSGALIPGRGGILDSIDSLSLAAPVFYIVFRLL
jgi:phosphatidate cytidylyltransferase